MRVRRQPSRGFTLVELMVVVVLVAVVLSLGFTNFRSWIIEQRLKSITSQLVTDLQYARSEAAARNMPVYFSYRSVPGLQLTCYSIYTTTTAGAFCQCGLGMGAACSLASQTEIKTVQIFNSNSVRFAPYVPSPPAATLTDFAFDNLTGGIVFGTTDFASPTPLPFSLETWAIGDVTRRLRTTVGESGRPTVCSAGTKVISGFVAC